MAPARAPARLLVFAALIAAPACGFLGSLGPETHYYTLYAPPPPPPAVGRPETGAAPGERPRALVAELRIATEYKTDRMLFRPSPYELGRYNYALWAAPPDILVHRALRDRLEASGLVDLIPEGALREIRPGEALIVDGRIDRFEEVDIPNGAEGRVALALTVRTAGGADALLRRTYDRARPMALQSPEALARALSEALDEALGAFLGDLRQALAKRK